MDRIEIVNTDTDAVPFDLMGAEASRGAYVQGRAVADASRPPGHNPGALASLDHSWGSLSARTLRSEQGRVARIEAHSPGSSQENTSEEVTTVPWKRRTVASTASCNCRSLSATASSTTTTSKSLA